MPVIVMASPKGGAGKSTTAIILATELAHAGAEVMLLDCDPNRSASLWASQAPLPPRITCVSNVTESDIVNRIKQADGDGKVVIVDLEGVASRMMTRAISKADLVLVPMRTTTLDSTIGSRALALIREEEETLDRPIRHAVVFTATSGVKGREHRGIEESLIAAGVDVINPPLMQRAAFSALFHFGGDLHNMPLPLPEKPTATQRKKAQEQQNAAIQNAQAFAQQVINRLTGEQS